VIDTSFISLTLVLPKVAELLGAGKTIIALIKPQFEVGRADVGKGGVVRDPAKRQGAVDKISAFAGQQGWRVRGTIESPILGPAGNVEYLIVLGT
jgi:23S rRNA (cytidine1920-2'-O)/16S rRNA (cytidine1409-2'-O)-methyltransferase